MNFSRNSVEKRAQRLHSPRTHKLVKLQLFSIRIFVVAFLFLAGLGVSVLYGTFRSMIETAPDIDSLQIISAGCTTTILDTEGSTIQTLAGQDASHQYVTLEQIPANLQNAFISIEDKNFWNHEGANVLDIFRTLWADVTSSETSGKSADTLTQQLLQNQIFLGNEEKTLSARFKKIFQEKYLILQIEKKYDKQQILEYYLNTINLGQNTLGVQAASKRYFNKDVSELSLSECAVLAGITQNPTEYNPISHPAKNKSRQATVLTYMKEQGYITTEEYNEAVNDKVYDRIQKVNADTKQSSGVSSYFTSALISQIIKDLKERLGYTETQAYNTLYSRGLTIYSTQDSTMQKTCDSIVNNPDFYPADSKYQLTYQLTVRTADGTETSYDFSSMKKWYAKKEKKKITAYYTKKAAAKKQIAKYKKSILKKGDTVIAENISFVIQPQVSFVLMDQYTGNVKALCGGRETDTENLTTNRATDTTKQPGSVFKVLSTYLPALDTAGMSLATVQNDAKYYYPGTKTKVTNWYGDSYLGLTSMRTAIIDSMNVTAVKTLEQVTPKVGYDYLLNLGFSTLIENYTNSSGETYTDIALPLALGELTKGVTNLELTNGFATIANGGTYHAPHFYTSVVDKDGNVLLNNTDEEGTKVMKDSTAWLLTSAMEDVVNKGTGDSVKFKNLDMPEAGKTGITADNTDLWFVGYTPYLTAGIWGGYDDSQNQSSSSYHKEIWRAIMEKVNENYHGSSFPNSGGIVSQKICTKCGNLAIDGLCDEAVGGSCVMREYFSADTVPTETCDCHVKCKICKSSGHLASDDCPSDLVYTMVYLQKKDSSADTDETADQALIIPSYLSGSTCEIHG
jgi:penicillin-binding protein 1A